jgi:hypothetical protein
VNRLRRAGRALSPITLVLAGLCFLLPFVTVSCGTPGGFGRSAPGGSPAYTGVDLVVGGAPDVSPERLRPLPAGEADELPPQPAAAMVLVLVVAAIGFAVRVRAARPRRAALAVLGGVAATALLVNQALVEAEVTLRVADHLTRYVQSGQKIPDTGSTYAGDYVDTGPGFVVCLVLLAVVAVVNGVGWWRTRRRAALVAT